jgi:hypothetical protein
MKTKAQLFKTAIVDTHDSIFDIGTVVAVEFLRKLGGMVTYRCTRGNQVQALSECDLKGFVL